MSIEIKGDKELAAALIKYKDNSIDGVSDVIRITTLAVMGDAIKSIQRGTKTGKIYSRGDISHQSSAPGEAPATDRGTFVASIQSIITDVEGFVGTDDERGPWFEWGNMNMKARPWLTPARNKNAPLFRRRLIEVLK